MSHARGDRGATRPFVRELAGGGAAALTVDVEEWYHTCHVPDYLVPERRPRLVEELDRLLPELLERLARTGAAATFFVLGEVASRLPARVREIAAAGHEVASHGHLHLRVNALAPAAFRRQLADGKARLEDLTGRPVLGYRAPEWSLRRLDNPRLRLVAAAGFAYDSSLVAALGSGRSDNPRRAVVLSWADGRELVELPPLTLGALWLPAGGWTGRLAGATALLWAARVHARAGGVPTFAVHPWELARRPTPGDLTGLARFLHETGRGSFHDTFERLLGTLRLGTLEAALYGLTPATVAEPHARVEAEAPLPAAL